MKTLIFLLILTSHPSFAADKQTPSTGKHETEEIDLSKITEKYWADGNESELGVVQNRKYSSSGKVELGLLTGKVSSDPFLSVKQLGFSLGYHLNAYSSIHALYWKSFVSASEALKTFESETGSTVNTNQPKAYYGADFRQNVLYGKASLLGRAIIYVDLFVIGGIGMTVTESGSFFTPSFGLGQKIYLSERLSLNLDYRIMRYGETILSKNPATLGNTVGTRTNTTDAVSLGLSFFLF